MRTDSAAADFAAVLLGDAGRLASATSAQDSASIGRDSAWSSGSRKNQKETVKRARAQQDPASVAAAELASRGQPKATVESAVNDKVSPKGEVPQGASTRRAASPERSATAGAGASQGEGKPGARSEAPRATVPSPAASPKAVSRQQSDQAPKAVEPPKLAIAANADRASDPAGFLIRALRVGAAHGAATPAQSGRAVARTDIARPAQKQAPVKAPTAPKAQPQPRNTEEHFAAQLGRGFAAILRQSGGSLTLRLQPNDLGEMTIRLDMKPGKVNADFEVSSEQARKLLGDQLSTLRSALEARGLDVDRLTVRVSDRPTPEAADAGRAEPWLSHGGTGNAGGGAADHQSGHAGQDRFAAAALVPARIAEEPVARSHGVGASTGGAQTVALDAVA